MSDDDEDSSYLYRGEAAAKTLLTPEVLRSAADHEQAFLVPQAIPSDAVIMIMGAPGEKKSWLAYTLAISVARGTDWLGFGCAQQGGALIINVDNPRSLLGRRMVQLGMRDDDPLYFHTDEYKPWRLPEAAKTIQGVVGYLRPSLVVIDSLRQFHTADENSSAEMARVMGFFKSLRVGGATVCLVHHAAKSSSGGLLNAARGSGEITSSCDAVVTVQGDVAYWDKHRGWEIPIEKSAVAFELLDTPPTNPRDWARTTLHRGAAKTRGKNK